MKKQKTSTNKRMARVAKQLKGMTFAYETYNPEEVVHGDALLVFKFGHSNPVLSNFIHVMAPAMKYHILDMHHEWEVELSMFNHNADGDRTVRAGTVTILGKLKEIETHIRDLTQMMKLEAVIADEKLEYFEVRGKILNV